MHDFEIADNTSSNRTYIGDSEVVYIDVNDRLQVIIEPDEAGNLSLRIYPKTGGEYWDSPYTTFEVDIAEIEKLEKEMEE